MLFRSKNTGKVVGEIQDPQLLRIGPCTAIDVTCITAVYKKNGNLIIRFGGIGTIEVPPAELYSTIQLTVEKLLKYVKVIV
ncbi:hypothetical protein Xoosp13_103 [Xanthomonas phage Xoo-sp13]|nr:hypothetical protein Xoosp13_103 [Xanthomonas phage Xoo-sp13]